MEVIYTTSSVHFELRISADVLLTVLKIAMSIGNLSVMRF